MIERKVGTQTSFAARNVSEKSIFGKILIQLLCSVVVIGKILLKILRMSNSLHSSAFFFHGQYEMACRMSLLTLLESADGNFGAQ